MAEPEDLPGPQRIAAYWDDYLRSIEPDGRAPARVRRSLDRALEQRARGGIEADPARPVPRAAAVFFLFKSTAMSVGLAMVALGGLHVGARAWTPAPAELPEVAARAAADPALTTPDVVGPAVVPVIAAPVIAAPVIAAPTSTVPTTTASPRAAPRTAPPTSTARADELRAELELIERARAALARHDDKLVVTLLDEHAKAFAHGAMIEERLGWTAIVRCRRAAADARATAERFARDYPRSSLLDDIHHACASHSPTDPTPRAE